MRDGNKAGFSVCTLVCTSSFLYMCIYTEHTHSLYVTLVIREKHTQKLFSQKAAKAIPELKSYNLTFLTEKNSHSWKTSSPCIWGWKHLCGLSRAARGCLGQLRRREGQRNKQWRNRDTESAEGISSRRTPLRCCLAYGSAGSLRTTWHRGRLRGNPVCSACPLAWTSPGSPTPQCTMKLT